MSPIERGALFYFSLYPHHLMCSWHAVGGQEIFVKELIMKLICTNIKEHKYKIKNQEEIKFK